MIEKQSKTLLEAIVRISGFSYETCIAKYPFLKEYLKNEKNPKESWILWVTAAGVGYALSKKEAYSGEHDELIKSITTIEGLHKIVENFAIFIQETYKNNKKLYPLSIGFWIITKIKNNKPSSEELENFPIDIGKLLDLAIEDYEKDIIKKCIKCNLEMRRNTSFANRKKEGGSYNKPSPIYYTCMNKECREINKKVESE